jgi:hypothetical protein
MLCLALLRMGFAEPASRPTAGALLPHRFTLTAAVLTGARTYAEALRHDVENPAAAVYFLLHFPEPCGRSTLSTILPSGARTFLPLLSQPTTVQPAIKITLQPNSKISQKIDTENTFEFAGFSSETDPGRCS